MFNYIFNSIEGNKLLISIIRAYHKKIRSVRENIK